MGITSSSPSALPTHTSTHSTSALSVPHRSFSVSPFEYSSFISVTKTSSKSYSYGPSPTRTGEYCTWDFEEDTSSCSSWTLTVDIPTPFTVPTPTGGYETPEASLSFPFYSCTDFLCIDSVVSEYGYSLCLSTPTPFGVPTETWSWPEDTSTYAWPTTTSTCDLLLDCQGTGFPPWESVTDTWSWPEDSSTYAWPTITSTCDPEPDCEGTGYPNTETWPTDEWPTPSWDTELWPTETSSDCDTPIIFTVPESLPTTSTTNTKHSYSYRSGSTRRTRTSTTSDCDFWDDDCTPVATAKHTTWDWDPDPRSDHTTISHPLQTAEAKK
ncbi:hypothetical protein F4859DRAFT_510958 [Xylaria cf. heliscus]|nr:hypothetical protein F4859DRAFT_510958 [Xylaria cf. heliscus]